MLPADYARGPAWFHRVVGRHARQQQIAMVSRAGSGFPRAAISSSRTLDTRVAGSAPGHPVSSGRDIDWRRRLAPADISGHRVGDEDEEDSGDGVALARRHLAQPAVAD
jgi:hypothetical protein